MLECLRSVMDEPLCVPTAVATAVFGALCCWHGLWDGVTLSGLAVLCVAAARLLQSAFLQRQLRQLGRPADSIDGGAVWPAAAAAFVVLIQVLLSPDGGTLHLLMAYWYLLVTAALLACVLQWSGSPPGELAEALSRRGVVNYSKEVAWHFYLGYLEITFDGEGPSFRKRMEDYLSANEITDGESRRNTCTSKMFILIPMKYTAMLSDQGFGRNDTAITTEKKVPPPPAVGGRRYGETQVYKVRHDHGSYRLAMEEATPLRTAARAVEDAAVNFDSKDFEDFADHFLTELREILAKKPVVANQLELVPVKDSSELGNTVEKHFLKVRQADERRSQR